MSINLRLYNEFGNQVRNHKIVAEIMFHNVAHYFLII